MKRTLLALALTAACTAAFAQGYGPGAGRGAYGPGMMGAGPGMTGYGAGMGPGTMGYYGGAGQGYGGGPGHGPGRGYGPGDAPAVPDLTEEQREKILAIQEDHRRKNWDTMGQIRSEQFKLRRIYQADQLDPNALAEQQRKVDELQRQMVKANAERHNQIVTILTPEQRKQVRQRGPWWLREGDEE